jgi:DNA polymerase III alpha subunit
MDSLLRVGAFDGFGQRRTAQFWEFRELAQWRHVFGQDLLLEAMNSGVPDIPLAEPSYVDRFKAETELVGFAVSGHPLEIYPAVNWKSYCSISELGNYLRQRVTIAGMIVEDRIHRQSDGRVMKFLSLCDYSGILECELFAKTYQRFGVGPFVLPLLNSPE